jgi:hypothetical protein
VPVTALIGGAAWIDSVIPLAVVLLTVAAVRAALLLRRHWPQRRRKPWARQRLALFPRFVAVNVREQISARFELDRYQQFTKSVEPPTGSLTFTAQFSASDRKELRRYRNRRKRSKRSKRSSDIDPRFSAGTLVLAGAVGVNFSDLALDRQIQHGRAIALEDSTEHHPFLSGTDRQDRGIWLATFPYRVTIFSDTPSESEDLPIWITPGIVPESDCRALELEVQWREVGSGANRVVLELLESLTVDVPAYWGAVQRAFPRTPVTSQVRDDTAVRRLEFRSLRADHKSRRLHLSVRFENRIELNSQIHGKMIAIFTGAISGISRVISFDANGSQVRYTRPARPKTQAKVDFILNLAGLRYQDVNVVSKKAIETLAIPDHITVAHLTNRLSEDGYYIKRVIENPPRGSRRINTVNRYWDIAGRFYDGIFPIGFHIIVTGEEEHDGGPRAVRGQVSVQLIVQGTFANEDMRKKIDAAWERLASRIKRALAPEELQEPTIDRVKELQLQLDEVLAARNNAIMAAHRLRNQIENCEQTDVHGLRGEVVRRIDDELLPQLRGEA